jgi:hypothetical protein
MLLFAGRAYGKLDWEPIMNFMKKTLLPIASAALLMLSPIAPSNAETNQVSGAGMVLVKSKSTGQGNSYSSGHLGSSGRYGYVDRHHRHFGNRFYGGRKFYPRPKAYYWTGYGPYYGAPGASGSSQKIVCHTVNRVIYHEGKKALIGKRACRSADGGYIEEADSYQVIRYLDY